MHARVYNKFEVLILKWRLSAAVHPPPPPPKLRAAFDEMVRSKDHEIQVRGLRFCYLSPSDILTGKIHVCMYIAQHHLWEGSNYRYYSASVTCRVYSLATTRMLETANHCRYCIEH